MTRYSKKVGACVLALSAIALGVLNLLLLSEAHTARRVAGVLLMPAVIMGLAGWEFLRTRR